MVEKQVENKEFAKSKIQEVNPVEISKESLKSNLGKLAKFGGFSFLEASIDGIQNVNPDRKARKDIYLKDEDKKEERKKLIGTLDLWIEMLENNESIDEMFNLCNDKASSVSNLLKDNQLKAVETVENLERAYREAQLFFDNTEKDKIPNISFLNASIDQLKDLDNPLFLNCVSEEFKQNYDRLDLRSNYSLLVIPGFLGSNKVIDAWSKIAYKNKVQMYTDFADLGTPDDVIEMFYESDLAGADAYKSNTCMSCNWPIGRGRYSELGEEGDMHVSPSSLLSGKIYQSLMSQITAGKKYGTLNGVEAVSFSLKKSEITKLEKLGLIPIVNEYNKVMAFSGKTLFNGNNLGLQTYSVVRVFDHVGKVQVDFLNRKTFENWTTKSEKIARKEIVDYLDSIKGPTKLIEKYTIVRFERDPKNKARIYLDIRLSPYFPGKEFIIKLTGTKGDEGTDWDSEYEMV